MKRSTLKLDEELDKKKLMRSFTKRRIDWIDQHHEQKFWKGSELRVVTGSPSCSCGVC
jgi:hypothetical protein